MADARRVVGILAAQTYGHTSFLHLGRKLVSCLWRCAKSFTGSPQGYTRNGPPVPKGRYYTLPDGIMNENETVMPVGRILKQCCDVTHMMERCALTLSASHLEKQLFSFFSIFNSTAAECWFFISTSIYVSSSMYLNK